MGAELTLRAVLRGGARRYAARRYRAAASGVTQRSDGCHLRVSRHTSGRGMWEHLGQRLMGTPAGESINTHLNEQISNFLEVTDFKMHFSDIKGTTCQFSLQLDNSQIRII